MIQVHFREPTTKQWLDWRSLGIAKTRAMIDEWRKGRKPKIDEKFYRRCRDDLAAAFHGKCAYCEQKITTSQRGDVEHFRPKGAIKDKHGKPAKVRGSKGMEDHPGYFWLAYEPSNLLLACVRCNQGTEQKDGFSYGKLTYFPVEGEYASKPGDEKNEKPLFFHPVDEDPERFFVFDEKTGVIGAADNHPRAAWCIERLGLNREELPERRRSAFVSAASVLEKVANATIQGIEDIPDLSATVEELLEAKRGRGEFTLIFRAALRRYRERARKLVALLGG